MNPTCTTEHTHLDAIQFHTFTRIVTSQKYDGSIDADMRDKWLRDAGILQSILKTDDYTTKGFALLLATHNAEAWTKTRLLGRETAGESFQDFERAAMEKFSEPEESIECFWALNELKQHADVNKYAEQFKSILLHTGMTEKNRYACKRFIHGLKGPIKEWVTQNKGPEWNLELLIVLAKEAEQNSKKIHRSQQLIP